ncbi:exonuclease domain-containing protein [Primorskyibacter aestuariivivens]|uniref:3'-5' exonuclease n=1 Tax=Primorskyibacter aestuariivivens TaxID=1888912 RepID=UPI002300C995|nr:exonuclease domain-containing protein [Primorskyibacter aestuariivivens]MDA7427555.1 exonuclease domain-containing protein [Primorskyibacter aestuariivivens]
MFAGWSLRLRVFLFFALLGLASLALIGAGLWLGYSRAEGQPDLGPFVLGGAVAGFAVLGLVTWIWRLFDENLARPMQALAAQMRVLAQSNEAKPLNEEQTKYLGDLAPAAASIAEKLSQTRSDLTLAIQRETTRLAEEKERLETLLADVNAGILLCSRDHNVVFYNSVARNLLQEGNAPRLNQPVTGCLREGPLLHAYERLTLEGSQHTETQFLCSTPDGTAMFTATMRLVPQGNERGGGYALTLRDVTADIGLHAEREALLSDMVDGMRRKAANLDTLVSLREASDDPVEQALLQETRDMARAVDRFGQRYNDTTASWWPVADISSRDLLDSLRARLRGDGVKFTAEHAPLSVACDGFMIVSLMAHLAGKLKDNGYLEEVALSLVEGDEGEALMRLGWEGNPLPLGVLEGWLEEPLEMGQAELTGRYVLSRHSTDIWPESEGICAAICLPLPRTEERGDHDLRGAVYDFSLFEKSRVARLADTPLEDLSYVVFDTETTGLLPSQGDEIVQIAALRVVGGKLLEAERLDVLVDPRRNIPEASTKVHGITEAMVKGAPGIEVAGKDLHDFAQGSVLVAHNAPFDMAFFHKHADLIGREFDNPVLDTVLLSAVIFGITEVHTLDALCERLGVVIPEKDRHTAMGDTLATGTVFVQMMQMLKELGYTSFGEVHDAMKKQMRLYKRN